MKKVVYLPAAAKALRRHGNVASLILEKVESYASDPRPLANNVKAMRGSSAFRLRVGDFQVVFEETQDEIIVTKIGPRGSIYD